jgi:D-serine deaminase-like pyridoxal phosphate-dependent protein
LTFEGITCYPGHINSVDEQGVRELQRVDERLQSVLDDLKDAGFVAGIVSGGSTPALFESHRVHAWNEIRPGTYIFNDRNTVSCGGCSWEDCAAFVLTTVVSTSVKGQMIIDGGSKTFSSDRLLTGGDAGFGHIVEAPDAVFAKMNEEHGYVNLQHAGREFQVGDKVRVIPNHICVVVNLHETVYGVRGQNVENCWKVEARGKLQ